MVASLSQDFDTAGNLDADRAEALTRSIALELLENRNQNSLWGKLSQLKDELRIDDKLMAWTMAHPALRVQLFRLIDCLPALQSQAEIARHMQEYLASDAIEIPALKSLLNFSTDNPNSPSAIAAAKTLSTAVSTLAKRYICGENLEAASKSIERLRRDRMAFTLDLLGEAVISETEAQNYLDRCIEMMVNLSERSRQWSEVAQIDLADGEMLTRVQVSVKLSSLYSQFDPIDPKTTTARVSIPVRQLLRRAKELGCGIHFDMEQYEFKSLTLAILKQILSEPEFGDRADIGITLQAYLRDSEADLLDLIAWAKERGTPLTVRLVKGAYWDRETIRAHQHGWQVPVWFDKVSTDANYERLTQILLTHHQYLYAAIGSHNARSLAKAIAIVRELQIPSRAFEVQCLYGMGERFAKAIVGMGYRVRVYCPYGELIPGMSYLIRRLLENTANSSFLRLSEANASAELIAAPVITDRDSPRATLRERDYRCQEIDLTSSFTEKSLSVLSHSMPEETSGSCAATVNCQLSTDRGFSNVSDRDFTQTQAREGAIDALERVRASFGNTYLPIIDGIAVTADEYIDSVNPANYREVVGTIGLASHQQADRAAIAAKTAFATWKQTSPSHRADILRHAADLMATRRAELAAWITWEVAKPLRESDAEVSEAIDFCRYYAQEMERLAEGTRRNIPGEDNTYIYQPRGVALVISPWNFPFAIAVGMSVAALVAGNTVIFKPAEQSSVIGAKIAEILYAAGVPGGAFNYLPARGSCVGAHLVEHPDIHLIAFTGSQQVGCQIIAKAAILQPKQRHLKRVIAEMGGKNGIIVDESADLDLAVVGVMNSAFGYAGQKCSACSRAIVLAPIYDNFLDRLVSATKSLSIGAAHLPDTKLSATIDAAAQAKIHGYIDRAKTTAHLALELPAPSGGYYVAPTIFSDVDPHDPLAQEEIFGPVLAVIKADTFDRALTIANDTDFALTGGLYSRTPSHLDRAKREFEVGNLYLNRGITGALVDRHPFGGFKLSGIGSKAGGRDYLLQFLEPRSISENTQRQGFAPGIGD